MGAMAMLGVFGTLISSIQAWVLERNVIEEVVWAPETIWSLLGFQVCLFGMYVLTSVFLMIADAALFNLSLLTSDVYSVFFAWRFQHQQISWIYSAAFATTLSGLVLY